MSRRSALLALLLVALGSVPAAAQVVQAPFDSDYTLIDLGPVAGVPVNYGGLTFLDPNTILIGGAANGPSGKLYSIAVVRGAGSHITGFSGTAAVYADAAYNDGGVAYGPGGVLFLARWPVNQIGQTKPGSAATDKIVDLGPLPLSVVASPGGLTFVPAGYPGSGQLKIACYGGGQWYTLALAADASGTYDVTGATLRTTILGGPEGFIYVPPGSPQFPDYTRILVSEYAAGQIAAYGIDTNGDPDPMTRVAFVTGLTGAEGAVIDPLTGDFLFSTFGGGNHVVRVQGFAPPPPSTTTTTVVATTTSTTGTTATTSTTATTATTSTTTTQPAPGCESVPTLAAINCRISALIARIQASSVAANVKAQLVNRLGKAKARKEAAEEKIAGGKPRPAGNMLKQAIRHLIEFGHRLKTPGGKHDVPSPLRDELLAEAGALADDLRTVRAGLRSPR